ncbi:hypothetical protein KP001_07125 [Geomonas subterranea]|uniref:Uncharacterized protein n=1 Tax=Geomonas subterranea TaxID=2847989 RepID=A0ABX8LK52_9BACT|nr:hypothetical protein [Geomonas subterranea]QXE92287.1 hypothetical protein KP001_07125 [Geomonas subterranea]QXM09614.1 hypothetical protein KP002_00370 [Geomonas subterranea]
MNFRFLPVAAIFLAVSGTASADTLVIRYSSGYEQTIELAGAAKDIKDIAISESSVSLTEKVKKLLLGKQPADEQTHKEPQPKAKKSGPSLQWAPPLVE